jgi:hypothetical protein
LRSQWVTSMTGNATASWPPPRPERCEFPPQCWRTRTTYVVLDAVVPATHRRCESSVMNDSPCACPVGTVRRVDGVPIAAMLPAAVNCCSMTSRASNVVESKGWKTTTPGSFAVGTSAARLEPKPSIVKRVVPAVEAAPRATLLARKPRASCVPAEAEARTAKTSPFASVATGPESSPHAATSADAEHPVPTPSPSVGDEQASAA